MKRIFSLTLIAVLCLLLLLPAAFAQTGKTYVLDRSGLLTQEERTELEALAEELSQAQRCDFYILTVDSLDGKSGPEYAEDYMDYNSLGYGDTDDCILLLVCMSEREFGFSGTGAGFYVLTDDVKADLEDMLIDGLRTERFAESFASFLRTCAAYVPEAREWEQYSYEDIPDPEIDREPEQSTKRTIAGAVAAPTLGFLFAWIPVHVMKRKNSNVSRKSSAGNYVEGLGLVLSVQEDRYLRTNTTRTPISTDSGSRSGGGGVSGVGGGHITSHTSSSGTTHSSGGGRF